MGTQVPCVFCCEKSVTLPSFSTTSDLPNRKDLLDVILGVDKTLCILKEPFKGLPLCGDCDLIYVHLSSLVIHLKSIQQRIDDLTQKVKAKVTNSDGKKEEAEFAADKTKNGKPVIRENCRRVRESLLKNRSVGGVIKGLSEAVNGTELVKIEIDEEKQKQNDVDLSRVKDEIEVDETPGALEEGGIRIKALSSLLEADGDVKGPVSDFQDSILIVPDAAADSATAPQMSAPKSTIPPMEDDTSSDSDLFRLLTRPNPLRRENLPCPGRKTKGCMQMFCTKAELMDHVMASHTSMNSPVAIVSHHRVKKCYFCTIDVRNHKDMRRHLRHHTREAPYFCKVCKKDKETEAGKSTAASQGKNSSTSCANKRSSFANTEELRRHLHMKHQGIFHKNANLKEVCEEYRAA